jgi:hypothetical protein
MLHIGKRARLIEVVLKKFDALSFGIRRLGNGGR